MKTQFKLCYNLEELIYNIQLLDSHIFIIRHYVAKLEMLSTHLGLLNQALLLRVRYHILAHCENIAARNFSTHLK